MDQNRSRDQDRGYDWRQESRGESGVPDITNESRRAGGGKPPKGKKNPKPADRNPPRPDGSKKKPTR